MIARGKTALEKFSNLLHHKTRYVLVSYTHSLLTELTSFELLAQESVLYLSVFESTENMLHMSKYHL